MRCTDCFSVAQLTWSGYYCENCNKWIRDYDSPRDDRLLGGHGQVMGTSGGENKRVCVSGHQGAVTNQGSVGEGFPGAAAANAIPPELLDKMERLIRGFQGLAEAITLQSQSIFALADAIASPPQDDEDIGPSEETYMSGRPINP